MFDIARIFDARGEGGTRYRKSTDFSFNCHNLHVGTLFNYSGKLAGINYSHVIRILVPRGSRPVGGADKKTGTSSS